MVQSLNKKLAVLKKEKKCCLVRVIRLIKHTTTKMFELGVQGLVQFEILKRL
jgi:hypothetical protein